MRDVSFQVMLGDYGYSRPNKQARSRLSHDYGYYGPRFRLVCFSEPNRKASVPKDLVGYLPSIVCKEARVMHILQFLAS